VTDIDMDLKRVFDDRLGRFEARPRQRRPRWTRLAVGVAIATLVLAGTGILLESDSVAAANGVSCANLLVKVQFWTQAAALGKAGLPNKDEIQRFATENGCVVRKVLGPPPTLERPQKASNGAPAK
jgi:hypothetical protein